MLQYADDLQKSLAECQARTSRELVVDFRQRLEILDEEALSHRENLHQNQRGEVYRFPVPGHSLPPGATQCPQALSKKFAALQFIQAGTAFTSSIFHFCLTSGKYMYEICVCSSGSMQIGFCGPMNMFLWDDKKGVGDFPFTVGYDGSKCQLHNVGITPIHAGWKWTTGDVISVTFDLDIGEVTYYQNGKRVTSCHLPTVKSLMSAGIQHSDKDIEMCYAPAVSLAPWEQCHINLGGFPFFHRIPGFHPIDEFAILERSWVPRLGILGAIPLHLKKFQHIIESMAIQKVVEDSENNFQGFVACAVNYTMALFRISPEKALDFIEVLRRTLPEDMFGGLASIYMTKCCVFSAHSIFNLPFPEFNAEFLKSRNLEPPKMRSHDEPNISLRFLEFVVEKVPESLQFWVTSPNLPQDLMFLAQIKTPNDRDLHDLYPEVTDEKILAEDGLRRLHARQQQVANEMLLADEKSRRRIFRTLLTHPSLRAQVSALLHHLVSELKECSRNSQHKRITIPGYSEQAAMRLFFHVITALADRCSTEDDKTIADNICPLSVLRMPTEHPNFSGISHEQLMASPKRPDFTSIPDIAPSSPECTLFLACDLYYISVKAWMVKTFTGFMNLHTNHKNYSKLVSAGKTPPQELAAIRVQLFQEIRQLSWAISSFYLVDLHPSLVNVASVIFRMVRYYIEKGYAQFIPVMFVECATDMVHFTRKTCPNHCALFELHPEIALFFMTHFRSKIIRYQPTREYILMTVGGLVGINEVHCRQALYIIENHLKVLRHFIAQVLDQFANTMAWTLVVNMLANFHCGNGFIMLGSDHEEYAALFGDQTPPDPKDIEAYAALNKSLRDYFEDSSSWEDEGPDSSPLSFFKNTVTHGNWCITELSSFLSGTSQDEVVTTEVKNKRQRGASVFDYTVKVLHILEGILCVGFDFFFSTTDDSAGTVPSHHAPPISAISKTMLVAELVGQCLGRFCGEHTALKKVCELQLNGLEKLRCTTIAAPLVGLLFGMMGPKPEDLVAMVEPLSTTEAIARYRAYTRGDSSALPAEVLSYVEGLVKNNVFFKLLACPRLDWDHENVLHILTKIDWVDACRKSRSHTNMRQLRFFPLTAIAYEALAVERARVKELVLVNPKGCPRGQWQYACTASTTEDEMCAICCASPLEVVFEPCGHSSCRPCIERHQINDLRCFYCKAWVTSIKSLSND